MVGSTLATAGVVFQGLLRIRWRPVHARRVRGAALGAMLAITFAPALAWAGIPAAPCQLRRLLLAVASSICSQPPGIAACDNTLLLAGVTMNAFFSALILFVQYFATSPTPSDPAMADGRSRRQQLHAAGIDAAAGRRLVRAFAWLARPLNLLSLGSDAAESRGLDVTRAQRVAL